MNRLEGSRQSHLDALSPGLVLWALTDLPLAGSIESLGVSSPRERFIMPAQLLDHGSSQIPSPGQLPVRRHILTGRGGEGRPHPLSSTVLTSSPLISSLPGPHLGNCRTRLLPDP